MNIKLSRIHRRDARRFEPLRRACHNVTVRATVLIIQTLALALLRCFCSRYKFPKFSSQENPLAAHSSQFVRVSFVEFWLKALFHKMIFVSVFFIGVCASIEYVVTHMSRLAVLWLVTQITSIDWNVVGLSNNICCDFIFIYGPYFYRWSKVTFKIDCTTKLTFTVTLNLTYRNSFSEMFASQLHFLSFRLFHRHIWLQLALLWQNVFYTFRP